MMFTTYGNAHTADYYIKASRRTLENFILKHIHRLKKTDEGFHMNFLDVNIIIKPNSNYILLKVDFIKLLKKPDITPHDLDTIENMLTNIITQMYPFVHPPVLRRIDLRYDLSVTSTDKERYFELWEKTTLSRGHLKKINPEEYKSESLYYTSESQYDSVRINIYDKKKEREKKGQKAEYFEANIIRFEIQLFNRHLNYMKKKHGLNKCIETYISDEMLGKYLDKYLSPIIFRSTYRSLHKSYEIVNRSDLSTSMKSKLKKFLRVCNKENIDAVRNRFATNTWSSYLIQLEKLDINPLPLKKSMGIDLLQNPISIQKSQQKTKQKDTQRRGA